MQKQLEQQLETRKAELDKIDTLQGKLETELEAVKAQTESLQTELEKFQDLEQLQKDTDTKRRQLENDREALKQPATMAQQIAAAKEAAADDSSQVCFCFAAHDMTACRASYALTLR